MNPISTPQDGGSRILAVDDVEAKRYAWQRILTRAGYEVSTAASGQEALSRVREKPEGLGAEDGVELVLDEGAEAHAHEHLGEPGIPCLFEPLKK